MIDLHIHTSASDGLVSPEEVVEMAIKKGLSAIAITDHDCVDGIAPAIEAAKGRIEVIPGVELSAEIPSGIGEVHVVGLFIDYKNPELIKILKFSSEQRRIQLKEMIKNLEKLGFKTNYEEVAGKSGCPTRGNLIRVLAAKYPEIVPNIRAFIREYLGRGGKAHVDRKIPELSVIPGG